MKKILALIMALAMVFALAACGGNGEDETTTSDPAANVNVGENEGQGGDETDSSILVNETDPSGQTVTDESGNVVAVDPSGSTGSGSGSASGSGSGSGSSSGSGSGSSASKGLDSSDIATVAAFYVKARKATSPAPKGKQTLELGNDGKITGDGAVGFLLRIANPFINSALEKNSTETDWIPGGSSSDIRVSDVKTAKATTSSNGRYTDVNLTFKEQTDGPNGDPKNGGPVARGVGTLGSIDGALEDLSAEISTGRDTVKLTYTDAYLRCRIDNNTGKIISGTWYYLVKINVADAEGKIGGVGITLKNIDAAVKYTVVI